MKMRFLQRGVSLIGAIVSAAIITGIVFGGVFGIKEIGERYNASARGDQYLTVLNAATAYAKKNQDKLLNKQVVSGFNNTMQPTVAELQAGGFLEQGFNENLPDRFGGKLKIVLEFETPGCPDASCVIAIKVNPSNPVKDKNDLPSGKLASSIALSIGTAGWTNSVTSDLLLEKDNARIKNPLPGQKAIVVAANWLPSNKPLKTFDIKEYQTLPCPAPQTGQIVQSRIKSVDKYDGVTYTPWIDESSTCAMPACNEQQQWNGTFCEARCPSPMRWNTLLSTCQCPAGQHWDNGVSTCVNDPIPCGPNEYHNGVMCVPLPSTCPANGPQNYPTCACGSNETWNGSTCVTIPTPGQCLNGATNYPACDNNVPGNPSCSNGATNYPACNNNVCSNGATNYPACDNNIPANPSTCSNGATNYPACNNNVCSNGATNFPTCNNNVCSNGATNFPACDNNQPGNNLSCSNGATNYPACDSNTCSNGATNYPACNNNVCSNGATNYPLCNNVCPAGGPQNWPTCACLSGFKWDGSTCVPDPRNDPLCPAGGPQNWPICACQGGLIWSTSTNSCVPQTCPANGPQNFPVCACAAGTTWNGSACKPPFIPCPGNGWPTTCTRGVWDTEGQCVASNQNSCRQDTYYPTPQGLSTNVCWIDSNCFQ